MGHEPQDISVAVHDAGDVVDRAIGIGGRVDITRLVGVTEKYLLIFLQVRQFLGSYEEVSFIVGDRDFENFPRRAGGGKWRLIAFGFQINVSTHKFQAGVAQHDPGKQSRFLKNLKAIANAQDEPALFGVFLDALQDW